MPKPAHTNSALGGIFITSKQRQTHHQQKAAGEQHPCFGGVGSSATCITGGVVVEALLGGATIMIGGW